MSVHINDGFREELMREMERAMRERVQDGSITTAHIEGHSVPVTTTTGTVVTSGTWGSGWSTSAPIINPIHVGVPIIGGSNQSTGGNQAGVWYTPEEYYRVARDLNTFRQTFPPFTIEFVDPDSHTPISTTERRIRLEGTMNYGFERVTELEVELESENVMVVKYKVALSPDIVDALRRGESITITHGGASSRAISLSELTKKKTPPQRHTLLLLKRGGACEEENKDTVREPRQENNTVKAG